ncbi:MAG TPA: N-acetylmuramoyl-L-alanine amidase [Gemmatimonadaceae bacterium]
MPLVEGALEPRVVYPRADALIATRDSNFIFGSIGHGLATLTIDGAPVRVLPNGSFIAFLPVPADSSYELVAALGADTARLSHPVRILPPRPALGDTAVLVVDSASVAPRGGLALRGDEPVRVSVRASPAATAWVELGVDTARVGRTPAPELRRVLLLPGRRDSSTFAADLPARDLRAAARVVVARGADTVRLPIARVDSVATTPRLGILVADTTAGAELPIVGRPVPGGTYKWFLLPGTVVELSGRSGAFFRVRLDSQLEIWVDSADVRALPEGSAAPRRVLPNLRVVPDSAWVDVVMPLGERPAFLVQAHGRDLVLTLYGTTGNTDIIRYAANDSLVRTIEWTQETSDRARLTVRLSSPVYGWHAMQDGARFVLRIRRPPAVDAGAPLRGRLIVVDAGHPPAGATGPTGLYEAEPVLDVAERVRALLEARGARVLMTRTTAEPVALYARPEMARRANADALVSVHLNALPDGVNPFTAQGTGVYFFHPPSEPLARDVQRELVRWLGLPNLGVYYDNLALVRTPWMPSILTEGLFIMMPEQEAAMRTALGREAYARGIADGLEAYFRGLASGRR